MVIKFIKNLFGGKDTTPEAKPAYTAPVVQPVTKIKYGVIVGSTRQNSFSQTLANGIVAGLPEDTEVTFIEIGNLPVYNQDYDADSPAEYTAFRELVAAQDAIIFTTPEHNRTMSAALKNALDVASRPWGQNVWAGKPALVASQSISGVSGVMANNILRRTLAFLDMPTFTQPEVYIGDSGETLGETGDVANADTAAFLKDVAVQFDDFVRRLI